MTDLSIVLSVVTTTLLDTDKKRVVLPDTKFKPSPPTPRPTSRASSTSSLSGIVPDQPTSLQRQTLTFGKEQGYGFLVKELELVVDAGPGCGGVTWPAAKLLARYLGSRVSRDPGQWNGGTVVELGAGTGILSLALASLITSSQPKSTAMKAEIGANGVGDQPRIVATDLPFLLPLMRENVTLNGLEGLVEVESLPWGEPIPSSLLTHRPDLVLAADCVYFEPAFPLLVTTLCYLADLPARPGAPPMELLFCYQKRRKADKRFFAMLKKEFEWKEVEDDPACGEYAREPLYLFRMVRKVRVVQGKKA